MSSPAGLFSNSVLPSRLARASLSALVCLGMLALAAWVFDGSPARAQTCEERHASCQNPQGGVSCCAYACSSRATCIDCCLNGFPGREEEDARRQCLEACDVKFPKPEEIDPPGYPPG